jgi:hypothetical protein
MKKKSFVWLIGFVFLLFVFKSSLFSTVYGSISGRVTDEDGKPLENVGVGIHGYQVGTTVTDKDGRYSFQMLKPGIYTIFFYPLHPYCYADPLQSVYVPPGKIVVFNKVIKLGGAISGKVIKKDGTPFSGVSVHAFARYGGSEEVTTGTDGKFFIGRLCPSDNYLLTANCNIPGYAYKVVQNVKVERGKETKDITIVFDLDDITGIEGYVTSSIDGKPLEGVEIKFGFGERFSEGRGIDAGEAISDKNGYYYIKNLEPGYYHFLALPPIKEGQNFLEWSSLSKEKENIKVEKGKRTKVDFKLDIPSSQDSSQ